MKYYKINTALFTDNRKRFAKAMKSSSMAVIHGNLQLMMNADALHEYVPNSDLFWLTGIEQEKSIVILYPSHPNISLREVLVILRANPTLEIWEGHKLTKEEATEISGIKTVVYIDELDAILKSMMHHAQVVYLNSNEHDRLDPSLVRLDLIQPDKLKALYPHHSYERAAPLFKKLREIKNKLEIELLQQAVNITDKAFARVMQTVKPGMMEFEIEAEIIHTFLINRSSGHAYHPIIASGDRARTLHYVDNNQECKDGELILMDFGARYANYAADLTRTIPVNGKYSKRQKEVYDACLAVHNYAKSLIKPGLSFIDYNAKVNKKMDEQLIKIGLLTKQDIKNESPENPARRRYYYHGLSHHLGIDVHDLGYFDIMKEGMVLTVEPGIYIEEENIGVRIENDVVITKLGINDLFKNIPITTSEIEACMKKKK